MKFLIDRCAGHLLAEWLRQQGHDVSEVRDRGPDPVDPTLLEWGSDEGRVVITIDKDFGSLLFVERRSHCGLIRLPDVPAAQRIVLVEQVLLHHSRDLTEQAIITVRGGRIRISRTP